MKKQLLLISTVALGLIMSLVPVCQAQSEQPGPQLPQSEEPQSEEPQAEEPQAEEPSAAQATSVRPLVFQAAGPTAASIQGTVGAFRAALGEPNNGNAVGPLMAGRREINWDGGGNNDTTSPFPPVTPFDVFLNSRGARFTTPGIGLTQAPPTGPEPGGGLAGVFNNPTYATIFAAFSPLRLFTPVGSNITEGLFFIPVPPGGSSVRATVSGFGAVFSDVDQPNGSPGKNKNRTARTLIEYFGADRQLLFRGVVPASPGDAAFSFFGIVFADPLIARVRITTGNTALGPNEGGRRDVVVMDDFLYGEPQMTATNIAE